MQRAFTFLALVLLASPALAQAARPQAAPAPAPAPAASPTPATPEPQRTTATFGDWTLRCVRPEHAPVSCEVTQSLAHNGQVVAQTAIGRPNRNEPLRLAILVPVNVSLTTQPRLLAAEGEGGQPFELTWRRCLTTGCIADAPITEDQLRRLRARTENAKVVFQDSAGREASLPVGPRGLGQALDALVKEDGR